MNDLILKEIKNKFIDTRIINENDVVLLAVSGGRDSMCLLDTMATLSEMYDFDIVVCHINHNIRDNEAKRDEDFVVNYCKELSLRCITKDVYAIEYSKDKGLSTEESARILRYKALNDIRNELMSEDKFSLNKKYYIATAHHKNDQAETIIHNIIRGSGLYGLKGMKAVNDYYIRPLLDIDRKEIEEYLKEMSISYVDDSTNEDMTYTRNYIRYNIINDFLKLNDKCIEHLTDLSNDIVDLYDYIDLVVSKELDNITISNTNKSYTIDSKKFKIIKRFIQIEIIKKIFDRLNINKKDISRVHFNGIIDLIIGNNNRHLDLPYNLTADKNNNQVVFTVNDINISMKNRVKK